jgi:hypothetical protein
MAKLREVNVGNGPDLGRVIDFPEDQAKNILAYQERRGVVTWEKAPKNAQVTEQAETPDEPTEPVVE